MPSSTGPNNDIKDTNDLNAELYNSSTLMDLNVLYFNSRSIANKVESLSITLRSKDYDLVMITETWLKAEHLSPTILNSSEHIMFRCDRTRSTGGGAAIIVKKHLASRIQHLSIEEHRDFELVAVDYYHDRKSFTRFACVYNPPTIPAIPKSPGVYNPPISSVNPSRLTVLVKPLSKLIPKNSSNSKIFIFGDFNFSDVDWSNLNSQSNNSSFHIFSDFLNKNNLSQLITSPTQQFGNTLDLVIASDPLQVLDIQIGEPFTQTCDHYTISLKINFLSAQPRLKPSSYNFHSADFTKINNFLSLQPWEEIMNSLGGDVNDMYSKFVNIIHHAFSKFVPKTIPSKRPRFPKEIRKLLRDKKRTYRQMKIDPSLKEKYKSLDKLYKKAVKNYFKSYEENIVKSANKNMLHSYIKKKLKTTSYLPPLINSNGTMTLDPQDKANTLNSLFSSIFLDDDSSDPPKLPPWKTNFPTMPSFLITSEDIVDAIKNLKTTVSQTPDSIPCLFYKKAVSSITIPLTIIFNTSLESGTVPEAWKKALVVPIFKKGNRNKAENYRAVSLTSVACRIKEKISHKKITFHLQDYNLLSNCQHGFIIRRSTLTQQLSFMNHLTNFQASKQDCDAIYLDFTKAFDKISHNKLIHVLTHYKINPKLVNWTKSFLENRTQQTVTEGAYSNSCLVTSGVPQGSVLGPLFFVLYLESLILSLQDNCQNTHIFAFADDVKLLSKDRNELLRALKIIEYWSKNWNLYLQPKKSEHLPFIFSNTRITSPNFTINNSIIPQTKTVKDLGITLSQNLKWAPYISNILSRANIIAYNIIRSFTNSNISLYSNLYKTYIRPIIEYNTVIWNPHQLTDIRRIESFQRRFTRLVCQKTNTNFASYQDRLRLMKLDTLESRRVRFDLIFMYKIYNKIIDIDFNEHFKRNLAMQSYNLRGHNLKLEQDKYSGSTIRNMFFSERIIPIWNALPKTIAESPDIYKFKLKLDKFNINTIYTSKI